MEWTTRYHETTKYIHMYWNEEPQARLRNWKMKIYCMQQPWLAAFWKIELSHHVLLE